MLTLLTFPSVYGRLIYHSELRPCQVSIPLLKPFQSYDYNLEKVKISTRIPLQDIVSITKGSPTLLGVSAPTHRNIGAYIVSPLEETSRDPIQNAGFIVEWRNVRQRTRVTSYSLRNSVDLPASPSGPNVSPNNTSGITGGSTSASPTRLRPLSPLSSAPQRQASTSSSTTAPPNTNKATTRAHAPSRAKRYPPPLLHTPTAALLSRLLSSTALPSPEMSTGGNGNAASTSFAAFKAFPIDPARTRREGSTCVESAAPDELASVSTCQEAVDLMVDAIVRACADAHAHGHTQAKTNPGKGTDKGKGKSDEVPSVRRKDIVRFVFCLLFLSSYVPLLIIPLWRR